jgi:uncharacterized protein (DUF608 family)
MPGLIKRLHRDLTRSSVALMICIVFIAAVCGHAQKVCTSAKHSAVSDGWTDISNTLGFPLGGIGTGYSAFGQYGFVHVNFDGRARDGLYGQNAGEWEYTADAARVSAAANLENAREKLDAVRTSTEPEDAAALEKLQKSADDAQRLMDKVASPAGFAPSSYGFVLREGDTVKVLQTNPAPWLVNATGFEHADTKVFLPRGRVVFTDPPSGLRVQTNAFVPLLPHDLRASATPVQVMDVTVENLSSGPRNISLSLENSIDGDRVSGRVGRIVFKSATGELSFATDGGHADANGVSVLLKLAAGSRKTTRFYIAWYYPEVDKYVRYYTRNFQGTQQILDVASTQADEWSCAIDAWHASIDVPTPIKRLWFGSLSAVETSTILTKDPFFLEVETPHNFYNTMDVFVYANWVYMINWPELERMDMDQFFTTIPEDGANAGLVLHSIWNDSADYVEEPTFLVRMRRDALWYNDPDWTRKGYKFAVLAANRVFTLDHDDGLIVSKRGNQSYDLWKMPGISSYVNSAWVYGLESVKDMAKSLGEPSPKVAGEPVDRLLHRAQEGYNKDLWNPGHGDWNVFFRTPGASGGGIPNSLFTDQLFGRWIAAIDPESRGVLPERKIHSAVWALYKNNIVDDPTQHFRGWVNGMQEGHVPDMSGRHAQTFWLGAQINLASLLGMQGEEAASLDVIESVEKSLGENVLAAGEWDRALNEKGQVEILPDEPSKDSPRFAPYPRYSSAWEYLIRLIGLQMDERMLSLKPFHTLTFNLDQVQLAGMTLTIRVQKGWTHAEVDGKPAKLPVVLDRSTVRHDVDFLN